MKVFLEDKIAITGNTVIDAPHSSDKIKNDEN